MQITAHYFENIAPMRNMVVATSCWGDVFSAILEENLLEKKKKKALDYAGGWWQIFY